MQKRYKEQFEELNRSIVPSDALLQETRRRMTETKPRKWLVPLKKTVVVVFCTVLLFAGAVNVSPAFAMAAAKVPIVRELVQAVAMDPSMKAAIEHNYVQLVKESANDNGYRIDVEYLVADAKNLTVYYKLEGFPQFDETAEQNQSEYFLEFELQDRNGARIEGYSASWSNPFGEDAETLDEIKFSFSREDSIPEQVQLQMHVKQELPLSEEQQKKTEQNKNLSGTAGIIASYEEPEPEYQQVACMTIPLVIDQDSLFNVRKLQLQQEVELEGQKIMFDQVEIYPSQIRILWHEDAANTQLIDNMELVLEGKTHGRWQGISNGISGTGMLGQPQQIWLDSSWFSGEEEYQLVIESCGFIPKETQTVLYDPDSNTFTNLPDYARLVKAIPCDSGLFMEFEFYSTVDVVQGDVLHCENSTLNSFGSGSISDQEAEKQGIYRFYNHLIVTDYSEKPITFTVTWAPPKQLEKPIVIPLV